MADYPQSTPGRGSVTGGQAHQPFDHPGARPALGGHPHGKYSSWTLAAAVVIAFLAGGTALILHLWWLFWACVGVTVLAVPLGKAIRIMDDTVVWGSTPAHGEAPALAQQHAQDSRPVAPEGAGGTPGKPGLNG